MYLEYLQFIILKFDDNDNNTPKKGKLSHTIYDGLSSLIKLWIANV